MEATGGIEPPNRGFADPCLTTWLRGLEDNNLADFYILGKFEFF